MHRHEAPPIPAPVFITGVVLTIGVAAVATGFGVSALVERDRQRALDPRLPRNPGAIDQAALFSDIFLITAGVLGVATIAIAFLTDFGGAPQGDASTTTSATLVPYASPDGGGAAIGVSF